MDLGVFAVVMMVVYAIFIVLGVALMILAGRALLGLVRLLHTLNDYWKMRTAEQYEARRDSAGI